MTGTMKANKTIFGSIIKSFRLECQSERYNISGVSQKESTSKFHSLVLILGGESMRCISLAKGEDFGGQILIRIAHKTFD